jgi:hypothetical protein
MRGTWNTFTGNKFDDIFNFTTHPQSFLRSFAGFPKLPFIPDSKNSIQNLIALSDGLGVLQERRSILARLLKGKLQAFVGGEIDMPAFQAKFTEEAEELASLPFGVPMLHLIG